MHCRARCSPRISIRAACGATIARAHLELGLRAALAALRVVIYGTGHSLLGDSVALTRKHFETPLGRVPCDTPSWTRWRSRMGDAAWHGELAPSPRASIEFETLYLKRRLGDRPFTIVPFYAADSTALASGRTDATRGSQLRSVDRRGARYRAASWEAPRCTSRP
jgi:AmmeMemoRadiSam system protein B